MCDDRNLMKVQYGIVKERICLAGQLKKMATFLFNVYKRFLNF